MAAAGRPLLARGCRLLSFRMRAAGWSLWKPWLRMANGHHVPSRALVPYCRISVDALVQSKRELHSAGCQVVVITPERQGYARRFKSDWALDSRSDRSR